MGRPQGLVVTIEQEIPGGIPARMAGQAGQHETFEEPGGVGQVPFAGACIVHALQHCVFGAERRGQLQASPADTGELAGKITLRGSDGGRCAVHGASFDRRG